MESGTQLGHYTILSPIGKGGMGEVWRARDTKLGREVAIKTLPEEFSRDPDRLVRFEREAKLLASLNHPNIAAIYGLEEFNGIRFLVLELVEGDTLADRLKRGAISVEESLKLSLQIAEALEAAHDKGVIHRDLKPANIKVTPEGQVKVLDFGLAKAFAGEQSDVGLSNSPTLSMADTQQGIILGTAAYMSPEQASGGASDKRVDIWSFGVVLFEMLTGMQVFEGESVSHILAAVLAKDPRWDSLPANLHPRLRELLERCLEKNAKQRWHDVADVRLDLEKVLADSRGVFAQPARQLVPASKPSKLPWVAAILFGVIAGFVGWNLKRVPPVAGRVSRFNYDLSEDQAFPLIARSVVGLSPDGRKFVYATTKGLYLRSMDRTDARLIPGTEEALTNPFFSSDGQWIGYWSVADAALKKISINGGVPVTLCGSTYPFGASWSEDNTVVYGQPDGVWQVSGNGGKPERILQAEKGEQMDSPQLLQGGKWMLLTTTKSARVSRWEEATIVAVSLESGERRVLLQNGSDGRYVPTGHLVYASGDTLFGVPFDLANLKVIGGPVPVIEEVQREINPTGRTGVAQYSFSDQGTLTYVPGTLGGSNRVLALVDRSGAVKPLNLPLKAYVSPRLSPDGRKLVVQTNEHGEGVLWVYDLTGRTDIQQFTLTGNNIRPIWTPDSKRVTFASDRDGSMSIYSQPVDGSGGAQRLTMAEEGAEHWPESWSPDGRTLSFAVVQGAEAAVWTLSADTGKAQPFADEPKLIQRGSAFSPDGHWLAYHSNESGDFDVYVQAFPPTGAKHRITQAGRNTPIWSSDGKELFCSTNNVGKLTMTVRSISTNEGLTFGSEQLLPVEGFLQFGNGSRPYDITPDSKQFLMIFPAEQRAEQRSQIKIVENWFEELKRLVPTR